MSDTAQPKVTDEELNYGVAADDPLAELLRVADGLPQPNPNELSAVEAASQPETDGPLASGPVFLQEPPEAGPVAEQAAIGEAEAPMPGDLEDALFAELGIAEPVTEQPQIEPEHEAIGQPDFAPEPEPLREFDALAEEPVASFEEPAVEEGAVPSVSDEPAPFEAIEQPAMDVQAQAPEAFAQPESLEDALTAMLGTSVVEDTAATAPEAIEPIADFAPVIEDQPIDDTYATGLEAEYVEPLEEPIPAPLETSTETPFDPPEVFAPELEQEPIEAIEEPYFEAETAEPSPSLDEASDALLAELDLELTGEEFNAPTELAEPPVLEEIVTPAADFDDPLDALDSATEPTETLSEFDLDAVFEEALASEPVVAELNEAPNTPAPVVEDVTLEALETVALEPEDPLDELMSIMGEEPEAAPNAARDAQTMAPPSLDTAEMGQGEAVELPEFDLPDDLLEANEGGFGDVGAGAAIAGVGVAAGAAALTGRGDQASQAQSLDDPFDLDIDMDDAFDENRFEAELARDMEFAAHDLEARSGEPLPDDIDAFLQEEANLAAAGDAAVAAQASGASRGLKVAAIVGSLAIAGALGLFFVSGGSTPDSAGPIVVEADTGPVKIKPEDPGGIEVPNQDRAVFTENDGGVAPSQPSLVTTSEEPVDLAALPQAEEPKAEDRLLPDQADGGAAATQAAEGPAVAPRRVRTLVVRPDGTLEERPVEETQVVDTVASDADAQSNSLQQLASLPAAETPAQPTTETSGTENAAAAAPATPEPAETSQGGVAFQPPAAAPAASQPTAAAAAPAQPRAQVPVRRVQSQTITPPVIRDRPADQPVNIVNATTQQQVASAPQASGTFPEAPTANTATAAPAPAPAPAAPASNGFKVQIASLPSQSAAQQTSAQLLSRYRNVLGGRGVAIRQAQIEGRGTFYRIQVEASSRDDASSLCQRYKAAGGDCIVTR